jgi:CBS domain-containing protein
MKSVKQILDAKAHKVLSVAPHVSVFDALQIMADKNVGALVVLDGDKLVGIFSERDYARKVTLVGKSSKETQVRDIMTTRVLCATPERTVEQCLALMTDKRVRHLPVIDHKKVIGVVSIGDMVKEMLAEQQFVIAQLESYIHQ